MKAKLEAVLLDMDGVVINSAKVADGLLVATASSHGVCLSPRELELLAGANGIQFWSYVKEAYGLPDRVETYRDSYDASAEVAAYGPDLIAGGLAELLRDLTAAGIKTGLVTSATTWRVQHVLDLVDAEFGVVVSGDDVADPKPAPTPYLLAAETLGVHPSGCLAVEDSARGVQSARTAGMVVLAYREFAGPTQVAADAHDTLERFAGQSAESLRSLYASLVGSPAPGGS